MTIKLLVVDDSALMRRQLTQCFEQEPQFIIRQARNGREAVAMNQEFEPDVITLDINMPEMDGLTALSHIMASRPVAVVMVSSLTEKGALATLEALALGAVDYIAKPGGTISLSMASIQTELVNRVKAAARARIKPLAQTARGLTTRLQEERAVMKNRASQTAKDEAEGLVLIGVSTGGPGTLERILPRLPAGFPFPVIVAQHMPPFFTGPFANRMNGLCELSVTEVNRPMPVMPGTVYVAKGGTDTTVTLRDGKLTVLPRPESSRHLWHPSVEVLGRSALQQCEARQLIGVMLTGMGHDGAEAFTELKKQGGRTIAESEESAIVFGMPKELIERGGASLVLPAEKIANQLISWTRP
jgi:two-component system chemotaxis response regulator CheB